jgi:hypothetical protein
MKLATATFCAVRSHGLVSRLSFCFYSFCFRSVSHTFVTPTGRGAPVNYHPGNQYFRSIVKSFQPEYLGSKRADKPEVACLVVERIRERGGRFLKRTKLPGIGLCGHFCWVDIGEQRAYEKACQALREGAPEILRQLAAHELSSSINNDSREDDSALSDEPNERDGA